MRSSLRRDDIQAHIVGTDVPAAVEAEKALLGIVLANRDAVDLIDGLRPEHFYVPLHGRLWAAVLQRVRSGSFADAALLDGQFAMDEAYRANGGLLWLQSLGDLAPGISRAVAYAADVREAAQLRDLLKLADKLADDVREGEAGAADIIGTAEASLLAMQASSRKLELVSGGAASAKVLAYLDAPPEAVYGVKTGLAPLDEQLGPLLPGDLVLMMGATSMGKSAAAACVAWNIADAGYGVIEANGEMDDQQMAQRHLADICHMAYGTDGPEYRELRRRNVTHDQRRMLQHAHERLASRPLRMIKRAGLRLSQLRSIARRQAAEWARQDVPLGALIVDHVGLLRPDVTSRNRYEDQTVISNAMKEMADELGCVVICLNQMNRENSKRDDKRPQLADLRDSGSWEQDADIVIGFHREQYYAQRTPEPQVTKTGKAGDEQQLAWAEWDRARRSRTVEAIILKNRAGPCLTVKLWGDVARNAIRAEAPEGALF